MIRHPLGTDFDPLVAGKVEFTANQARPGERVEITGGALRGLQGTVLSVRSSGRLLVAADDWQPGALLEVGEEIVAVFLTRD